MIQAVLRLLSNRIDPLNTHDINAFIYTTILVYHGRIQQSLIMFAFYFISISDRNKAKEARFTFSNRNVVVAFIFYSVARCLKPYTQLITGEIFVICIWWCNRFNSLLKLHLWIKFKWYILYTNQANFSHRLSNHSSISIKAHIFCRISRHLAIIFYSALLSVSSECVGMVTCIQIYYSFHFPLNGSAAFNKIYCFFFILLELMKKQ